MIAGRRRCPADGDLPCAHFIELIEEKAKNHRLQRVNEGLEDRVEELGLRIHSLEAQMRGAGATSLREFGLQLEIQ